MKKSIKVYRVSTIPLSLNLLLRGQLAYFNQFFNVSGISSSGEQLGIVGEREGVCTVAIEMSRKIDFFNDIKSLINLFRCFKKEKPTIVHSITPKAGLLCMVASYFAGVPIRIHTFTGLIFPYRQGFMHILLKNMDRITCFFATKIIPEGNGVKIDLENYKITNKRLQVIGFGNVNGINTDFFSRSQLAPKQQQALQEKFGLSRQQLVFCFVGRLVGDKGIHELVQAFGKLYDENQHVRLLLVGDYEQELDPLQASCLQAIQTHPGIIAAGWQDDVRAFLALADVFVFPSYREGFPNVVMQAGAMELPCIVSNINGCNEIIEEGLNGTIIPPKDANALYTAMKDLADNKEKRERYAQAARPIIEQRYKQEYVWAELLKEYLNLLAQLKTKA